ncbi:MAG: hypothetical protein SCALA702_00200 [Melioribacteraceae bacterium]|nr:MAG: hypothetical protein SCALA702_00200 [Melioribacteraceae bacterium]
MNRAISIISLIIVFGCSNQLDQFSNGLTKNASKITEYLINQDIDSLNGVPIDTLAKTEKIYNNSGQIIKQFHYNFYSDESMIIDFKYDYRKRLKEEIVELVNDSITFTVDYHYNGKLAEKWESEYSDKEFLSRQIGKYYYDSNDQLEKSTLLQLYVDLETKDTITNTFELKKYNNNDQVIERILYDSINFDKNRIFKYNYKDARLFKTKEYNQQDSLICTKLYEYQLDNFGNWIERKAIMDNELTSVIKREIQYK